MQWGHIQSISSCSYTCGHCGNKVASNHGWNATEPRNSTAVVASIYICHQCTNPTYFDSRVGKQFPGQLFGDVVQSIDEKTVEDLYNEARASASVNAYTACVLACRKLLMHVAVNKGAKENLKFIEYVEYLSDKNFVPPDAKDWVDHIRKKGNEANHEIVIMSKTEAEDLLTFIEMLLKLIYEFPATIKKRIAPITP